MITGVSRVANGNGNGNGGPWWVKAVTTLGLATILALGFFYWVTQKVDAELMSIRNDTGKMEAAHDKISGMITAHIDSSGTVLVEIRYLLYVQCLQGARVAKTDPSLCVAPQGITLPSSRVPVFERGRMFDR